MSGIQLLSITIQNISRTLTSSWERKKPMEADEALQMLRLLNVNPASLSGPVLALDMPALALRSV